MATNYTQMSTKKLNVLLEVASDEEKAEIMEVLSQRKPKEVIVEELTEDEQKILDAAETGELPAEQAGKSKLTQADCELLLAELKPNVGNLCRVVPFNTLEWVEAQIVGLINDKRANKVMYAIKCADGRRIVKNYDSKMLQILEEKGEIVRKTVNKEGKIVDKLSDEQLEAAANEAKQFVGNLVEFQLQKSLDKISGTIAGIVPDKRSSRILLRIEYVATETATVDGSEVEVEMKKVAHKVITASDVKILDEVNEDVKTAFLKRAEMASNKVNLTSEQKVEMSKTSLDKAVKELEKWTKLVEARTAEYEKAKADFEAEAANELN